MSVWHEHSLADAHQADLRREASHHRLAAICTASATVRRDPSIVRVQQRLGMLLVETGLHLITRTAKPQRRSLSQDPIAADRRRG